MQPAYQIYAVNAEILHDQGQDNVLILIYAQEVSIAKNLIRVYQQQHQIRLHYELLPLPLEIYFQRHADEILIERITSIAKGLSEQNPLILFYPDRYQEEDKTELPCLTKTEVLLREPNETNLSSLISQVPQSVIPFLWKNNDVGQCYVVINAQSSPEFPTRFERDDIRSVCLFKGEEAKKRRKTAPYLLELPLNNVFTEELFSDAPLGKSEIFQQWRKNFGFFFCSSASFEELATHFRRFIYMPTYDERALYFRFYDPIVLEAYLDRLICYPKKLATFFGGELIQSFVLPKGDYFVHYMPNMDLSAQPRAKKQFDKFEIDCFIAEYNMSLFSRLVDDILVNSPFLLERYSRKDIENVVGYLDKISGRYNFHESVTIGFFALATLLYGKTIDTFDPVVLSILEADYLSESNKIHYIQQRIELMENQGMITNLFGDNNGK